jgi:hypothetical protein
VGIQATQAEQALSAGPAEGVMDHLNWGYIQLGLVALVFEGLNNLKTILDTDSNQENV